MPWQGRKKRTVFGLEVVKAGCGGHGCVCGARSVQSVALDVESGYTGGTGNAWTCRYVSRKVSEACRDARGSARRPNHVMSCETLALWSART